MGTRVYNLFKQSTFLLNTILESEVRNLFSSRTRLFSSALLKKVASEAPVYKKTDHEYKITKKSVIQALENLLQVKTFNALKILSENKNLTKASSALIKSNHSLYLKKCINNDTLVKYPALLALTNVESKLLEIEKLSYNINKVAILLLLPLSTLQQLVQHELQMTQDKGKIATLSKVLKISEEKACEFMAKKPFLCSLSTDKMEEKVNILTSFGINLEDIRNDLWVLRYNSETIESRLIDVQKYKIDAMKTWMVRVQPEIFQNYVKRRSDNKLILGDNSLTEYLSERLECNAEIVNYLILKQPALKNKSLKKLKEIIDFLYAAGFKSHHICRIPKILVHSVETIKKRLKQLEDKNIKIDSLHMLTKSQKQFTQYYEALIKNKNKQQTSS